MKPDLPRLTLTLLGAGLLLAGCASHPARPGTTSPTQATSESQPQPGTPAGQNNGQVRAPRSERHAAKASEAPSELPQNTGIPACDDYLASYVACHRAAAIYKPDQIPARYEAMRTSLLRDSQDPQIRPNLMVRCNALASQLREALHGKSCAGAPAAPSSQDQP
ncbi:MAG: hypothetical protein HOQ10_11630 [Frateuria sp.]|uniref:hypothetical protein n=1 Tax=Frateuria sp. TaxID=2211372 RepID=UPI0017E53326|nr:hypothetical protein [Frateuria sp.]NUO73351.1 hypothetical protein [Frateuria sp.]NUR23219.1 hypothetical protein [Frateuria sp.]